MTRGLNHKAGSLLNGVHHHGNLCYTANLLQIRLTTDQSDHWENWVFFLQDSYMDKSTDVTIK